MIVNWKNWKGKLTLESILEVDPLFKSIVGQMPASNRVCSGIWSLFGKDIKTKSNLIEITDTEDEVSFMPDGQYQRFIMSGVDPKTKSKNISKVGRLVRSIMSDNGLEFTDKDIEEFVNYYKSIYKDINPSLKINVVNGNEILKWYKQSNYKDSGKSVLGNSCMRYEEKNHFMKIYAENKNVEMACVFEEDEELIVARALIWKLDDGSYYLDRVYYNNDNLELFVKKWFRKTYNSNKIRGEYSEEMKCEIENPFFEKYPYVDTFKELYIPVKDGVLQESGSFISNVFIKTRGYMIRRITETNGGYEDSCYFKLYNGTYGFIDDVQKVDGVYYLKSELVYSSELNIYIRKEDATWSEYLEDWIPNKYVLEFDSKLIFKHMVKIVITKYKGDENDSFAIKWYKIKHDIDNYFEYSKQIISNNEINKYHRIRLDASENQILTSDKKLYNDIQNIKLSSSDYKSGYMLTNDILLRFDSEKIFKMNNQERGEINTQIYMDNTSDNIYNIILEDIKDSDLTEEETKWRRQVAYVVHKYNIEDIKRRKYILNNNFYNSIKRTAYNIFLKELNDNYYNVINYKDIIIKKIKDSIKLPKNIPGGEERYIKFVLNNFKEVHMLSLIKNYEITKVNIHFYLNDKEEKEYLNTNLIILKEDSNGRSEIIENIKESLISIVEEIINRKKYEINKIINLIRIKYYYDMPDERARKMIHRCIYRKIIGKD